MLRKLGLSLLTFVLALGALEGFLRLRFADRYYVWPPYFQRTMTPDPGIVGGVSGPSRFSVNAFGMRADPWTPDSEYRLLAVGGSTTICTYLDDAEAWPRQVQERVNAALGRKALWVGNVGRPGHATPQHVLQVQKLLDQHPEIDGVVLLVGINDMIVSLNLRGVSFRLPDARQALEHAFAFPGWGADAPWYERTGFARLWRTRQWRTLIPGADSHVQDEGAINVAAWQGFRRRAGRILGEMPDLSGDLQNYERSLNTIVDLARTRKARVLFLTQPTLWRPDLSPEEEALLWMGGPGVGQMREGADYYSAAALAEGMQQYNETLLRVCARRRVECIDVAAALPKSREVFWDDAHFTEKGASMLASLVADHLLEREPFGSGGSTASAGPP